MELIELEIPEGEQLDFQIAFVDAPAIESDWIAFDKVKQQFQIESQTFSNPSTDELYISPNHSQK